MKFLPALFLAFVLVFLIFFYPNNVSAATIFEDDFNSYDEGGFPTKWQLYGSTCNPNWRVEGGVLKITIGIGCGTHLIPNSTFWPQMLDNYVFESDIRFVSGIDRHFLYRINPIIPFVHVLHFAVPGDFGVDADNQNFSTYVGKTYQFNTTYKFRMEVSSNRLKVYLFDFNTQGFELIRDISFSNPIPSGVIGLGSSPGGGGTTETWFDNVKVTTPGNSLNVPPYKQTDPLWVNDIYDSANLWASSSPTIGRWGCAITSAVMVLNYNNITKLPDGTNLNPSTLNNYLLSVPGGYKRNGATNWEKIASMTKEAKASNPNFAFDALKYIKGDSSLGSVESDIENNIPDILEVPLNGGQHFVVAKHVDNSNVLINDPGFDRNDLSEYDNSFVSTRRFIPSNTDLSYLVFDVDPNIDIQLKDTNGNVVSSGELEFPIADPFSLLTNSIGALRVISYAEPDDGEYIVEVSSDSDAKYSLDGYLYDQSGKSKIFNEGGIVGINNKDFYNISFNKNNVDQSIIINPITTFDSLLADLTSLYQAGHITKKGSYNYLTNKIQQAKSYSMTNIQRSKDLLLNIRQQLVDDKRRGIDVFASQYLIDQIDVLLTSY